MGGPGIIRLALTVLVLGLWGCMDSSQDLKYEKRLQPVIRLMDDFIAKNKRLPTSSEFDNMIGLRVGNFSLRDRDNPYAASKGAKGNLDYMIGTWRADWNHYYKSWDKKFLNGYDEDFTAWRSMPVPGTTSPRPAQGR